MAVNYFILLPFILRTNFQINSKSLTLKFRYFFARKCCYWNFSAFLLNKFCYRNFSTFFSKRFNYWNFSTFLLKNVVTGISVLFANSGNFCFNRNAKSLRVSPPRRESTRNIWKPRNVSGENHVANYVCPRGVPLCDHVVIII